MLERGDERGSGVGGGGLAGGAQRGTFLDIGAGQQVGAGVLESSRNLRRPMSVRVCLDDGDDARSHRSIRREKFDDRAVIGCDGAHVDARHGRADH